VQSTAYGTALLTSCCLSSQDPLVTLAMARAYESIPGCQAVYFPSETHTTLVVNRLCLALEALAAKQMQLPFDAAVQVAAGSNAQQQVSLGLSRNIPGAAAAAAAGGVGVGVGRSELQVGQQLPDALSLAGLPLLKPAATAAAATSSSVRRALL
jgi:hypothetical protein